MKKRNRKLIGFLMVFALLGGLLCGVNTVKAQEPLSMERAYARQVTITEQVSHPITNKVSIPAGSFTCLVNFTYDLPSGQPMVSVHSYSTTGKNGYQVKIVNTNINSGNPTILTIYYSIYQNGNLVSSGLKDTAFYNSGTYN